MATQVKRLMVTVPEDIEAEIEILKKTQFYDESYSEVYRQILRTGVKALKEKKQNEACKASA